MSEYPVVDDAFDLLAKNTELPLTEYTLITQSQADIEQLLSQHISTFSTVLFGAFSRKTIVSPLPGSIVDMLVVFRDSDVKYSDPSRIFSKLRNALIEHFPDAYALKDKNILMIPGKNFHYKIHPAYALSNHNYMLPHATYNEWVKYDIRAYNEHFVTENVRHKGRLIHVVRMLKTWNRVSGNLFNDYYLELVVTDILSSYEIKNYAETLRFLFKAAVAEVVFQKHDPANMEFQIGGLNDISDLIGAMKLIKRSYSLADKATTYEHAGNTEKALENWRELFLQAFPTPLDMLVGKTRNSGIKGVEALKILTKQN